MLACQHEGVQPDVVAFGKKAELLTAKPTSDPVSIRKAVHAIKADTSGVENVFGALRHAASIRTKQRKFVRI